MSISTIEPPTDTALVVIPSDDASVMAAFTSDFGTHLEPILARIKREVEEFQKVNRDPRSRADREEIKSFARKLVKTRTGIEALGKALADRLKALPKRNDENRRLIRTAIENFEVEVLAPVSLWDAEEKLRIDGHLANIRALEAEGNKTGDVQTIRSAILFCEGMKDDEACEEFRDDYRLTREAALAKLRMALAAREQHERDQAELAALRAAQAERDAKERAERENQERIARDHQAAIAAAEAKQREAEQRERDAIAAKERAELQARLDEERSRAKALQEARDAEERQKAAEAAQKAEDEKRARNKAHRARVNNVAADALANVMKECLDNDMTNQEIASAIVAAIAKDEIPAVKIEY